MKRIFIIFILIFISCNHYQQPQENTLKILAVLEMLHKSYCLDQRVSIEYYIDFHPSFTDVCSESLNKKACILKNKDIYESKINNELKNKKKFIFIASWKEGKCPIYKKCSNNHYKMFFLEQVTYKLIKTSLLKQYKKECDAKKSAKKN